MILSLRLVYPRRSSPYLGFRSPTIPAVSDVAFWERSTGIMHDKKTGRNWVRHFLPLLRPFRKQLSVAVFAMVLDALVNVFRPWPLKVVIDRGISHKPSRGPFLHCWLGSGPFSQIGV